MKYFYSYLTFFLILIFNLTTNVVTFSQENITEQNLPYYLIQPDNNTINRIESNEAPPRNMNMMTGKDYYDAYQKFLRMPDENLANKKNKTLTVTAWQTIGPNRASVRGNANIGLDGRLRCFFWYLNTANPNDTYWQPWVGACSGGIFYKEHFPSDPSIERWISAGENLPTPTVGAIYVRHDDIFGNEIFVGSGDWSRFNGAGLYHSTNQGRSWLKIPMTTGNREIIPTAITDIYSRWGLVYDTLFVASDSGFFRSTNAGSSFSRIAIISYNEAAGVFDMVQHPTDLSTLYAALPGHGIYKTTNSGTSWFPVNTGINVSSDMGRTISIAISQGSPNLLYTVFTNRADNFRNMYKTTNGGTSWATVSPPSDYMVAGQGFHVNCVAINPTDPNKVYAGSVGLIRTTNGGSDWEYRDPGHSDITQINFSHDDTNILYITCDGGIFIKDENANTVQNINERFYPYAPIQEYGMDIPDVEANTIVSGTQDNGTMITLNGFPTTTNNWEQFSGCDGANNVCYDPRDANIFYFNSWCGSTNPRLRSLTKSSDFSNINNGIAEIYYSPLSFNKYNTNYIFTTTNKNLYYSSNRGDAWQRVDRVDSDFVYSEFPKEIALNSRAGTPTCYVCFWVPRSYIYTDPNPEYRIKIFEGTPGNMTVRTCTPAGTNGIGAVVTDLWDANIAYAFTDPPLISSYKTTDRGHTWNLISGTIPDSSLPAVPCHVMVSKPSDPNTIYAGTDFGVFKTTNNGSTWHKYQYGLPIVPIFNMNYIQSTPNDILKIGTFGRGFWYRELNGEDPSWLPRPTTIDRIIHCPDTTLMCRFYHRVEPLRHKPTNPHGPCFMVANDRGTVERSINGGMSWEMLQLPTKEDINDIFSMADGSVLVVGEQGGIFYSNDLGDTWNASKTQNTQALRTVTFLDQLTGFAAGAEGLLLRTDDGGVNWTSLKMDSHYGINNIRFLNTQMGVATGFDYSTKPPAQFLLVTTDGGLSWNSSSLPKGIQVNNFYFKDQNSAFIIGNNGEILVSGDFGQSWKNCNNNLNVALYDIKFKDTKTGWISGEKGTILTSTDGGYNWFPEETNITDNLYSIAIDSTDALAIGDTVMLKRLPFESQDTTSGSHIINVNFDITTNVADNEINYQLNCYPNPVSDITNIEFKLPFTDHLTLKVFDCIGREISTIADDNFEAGSYLIKFNTQNFQNGVYYLRVSSLRHNETSIITIMR
ncbi:MAG: YCF48-related protein [FCB group bacterium]|jgi:photosystem II stability/assembly factor-like uncharacterized protein